MGEDMIMKTSDKFFSFHQANPHVYRTIVVKCRQYRIKHGKRAKLGMKRVFEEMRWDSSISTRSRGFKLNNSHASQYARLVMLANDDLSDIFNLREAK